MPSTRAQFRGILTVPDSGFVDNTLPDNPWVDNTLPGGGNFPDNSLPGAPPRPSHPIYIPGLGVMLPIYIQPGVPTHPIEIVPPPGVEPKPPIYIPGVGIMQPIYLPDYPSLPIYIGGLPPLNPCGGHRPDNSLPVGGQGGTKPVNPDEGHPDNTLPGTPSTKPNPPTEPKKSW